MSPDAKVAVQVDGRTLTLTNLGKVLYPESGFTKAEVLDYYQRVAPVLLPHIAGRPLTLKRYPEGVDGQAFFQKHVTAHRPDWIRTARVDSDSSRARGDQRDLPSGGRPARAHLGGQPGRPGTARPDVADAARPRARPAGVRPRPGHAGEHRGLLPGGLRPAADAGGGRPGAAGQDLGRQGPAAVRDGLRDHLRAGQRPGPGLRRTTRTRPAPPRRLPHDQGAAHRQGPDRLEPEQRLQDHRRPLLAARPPVPHRLHPG